MSFLNTLSSHAWDDPWGYPWYSSTALYYHIAPPPPPSYFTKMVPELHPQSSPRFKKKRRCSSFAALKKPLLIAENFTEASSTSSSAESSSLFLMHDSGKHSIAKLDWKPASNPFLFGSFESVNLLEEKVSATSFSGEAASCFSSREVILTLLSVGGLFEVNIQKMLGDSPNTQPYSLTHSIQNLRSEIEERERETTMLPSNPIDDSSLVSPLPQALLERLKDYDQEEQFVLLEELPPEERDLLVKKIKSLDLSGIDRIIRCSLRSRPASQLFVDEEVQLWKQFRDKLETIMVMLDKRYIADSSFNWFGDAQNVFDEMAVRDVVSCINLCYMITAYVSSNFPLKALNVFYEINVANEKPNSVTLVRWDLQVLANVSSATGICLFFVLICVIWAPMLMYSSGNPTNIANPITGSSFQVDIKTVSGMLNLYQTTLCERILWDSLNSEINPDPYGYLDAYNKNDIQLICCPADASTLWLVAFVVRNRLMQFLELYTDMEIFFTRIFSRDRPKGKEVVKYERLVDPQYLPPQSDVQKVLNGSANSFRIYNAYPRYFHVTGSGDVRPLEEDCTVSADLIIHHEQFEWWVFKDINSYNVSGFCGGLTGPMPIIIWTAKQGWKSTFVDLDIGQVSITILGCIAATPIEMPIDFGGTRTILLLLLISFVEFLSWFQVGIG